VIESTSSKNPGRRARRISVTPRWASFYLSYLNRVPNHRGKKTFLELLRRTAERTEKFFLWRMKNGMLLAISPLDGVYEFSVAWMCFKAGIWEPHIERCLRQLLQPGQVALDVGANIGYFSAVMAESVGPAGTVWAFEPVERTFEQLALCRVANHFHNMRLVQAALGATEGQIDIFYSPALSGTASIYGALSPPNSRSQTVAMLTLDGLVAAGKLPAPHLIKIDVEGHECAVFTGAQETIRRAAPTILFEYNSRAATAARWALTDVTAMLSACADYEFYLIEKRNGRLIRIDPHSFRMNDGYIDLLAITRTARQEAHLS